MAVRIEAHAEPLPGYKLIDRIGAGGFGEVWRAEVPGGIQKAIKFIHGDLRSKDNDLVRYAEQELKSLKRVKQVRHPYLLALDRFDIVEGRLLIVMELADCNLWDRFRACRSEGMVGIPRDELLLYLAETAEVLDLFNDQFALQHLDIKPQNLFMLANHVKVADFGQVKDLEGLVAPVTGGITPVYAAPETFDGIITRTCDQYSLACVYQELLTGMRPFDGTSMSQLLMQHVNLPPNLAPSPACDRPALSRALAKKPEDRWPSVMALVRGLLGASSSGRFTIPPPRDSEPGLEPEAIVEVIPPTPLAPPASDEPLKEVAEDTPSRDAGAMGETAGPMFTPAPPEMVGPGPLRPTLVIGLGRTGLRVLRRLRFDLTERHGQPEMLPIVRTLYIDTDPDDLALATSIDPPNRFGALDTDEIYPAQLHRTAHYLKPRMSGRMVTEGWFDPQLLYKIPRTPQTMGLRMFGRLAFCDHYRALMGRIHVALDMAVAADAMTRTETWTGMLRRTNRPRVYVVAGTGGGTGSGMFLDVAYAVRTRLKRIGYESAEVIGILIAPPADPTHTSAQALANSYATLTELNHYSRPGTTFIANYDERLGLIQEQDAPFTRYYIVPGAIAPPPAPVVANGPPKSSNLHMQPVGGPPGSRAMAKPGSQAIAKPGSRVITKPSSRVLQGLGSEAPGAPRVGLKPFGDAADLIRLNLFTPLGRVLDETRAEADAHTISPAALTAFGLTGFGWPRAEVVSRSALKVARAVLRRWASPNAKRMREVIPGLAQAHWTQLGLDSDAVQVHLQDAADRAAGGKAEQKFAELTEPLVPRGWLARLPEPERVAVNFNHLLKLLGMPSSAGRRTLGVLENAVAEIATEIGSGGGLDVHACVPGLVDDPQFRLTGAEDMLRQFHATTVRLADGFSLTAGEQEAKARTAFDCVAQYARFKKGMHKPAAAEFGDAIKQYPKAQFQAILARHMAAVYNALTEVLTQQLADVSAARARLEAQNQSTPQAAPVLAPEIPPGNRQLMPPGCTVIAEAVERFLGAITDGDLNEIDRRVQLAIEPKYGTVFQACLNSITGSEDVQKAVYEETRAHLDARLGTADFAAMFSERYRTPQAAEKALEQTFHEAEPSWVGSGSWVSGQVTVVGCPAGAAGEPLRELSRRAIPVAGLPFADTPDDLTVYREWPGVPLAALPHTGAVGVTAFQEAADAQQCTPHSRVDVTVWTEIDAP